MYLTIAVTILLYNCNKINNYENLKTVYFI